MTKYYKNPSKSTDGRIVIYSTDNVKEKMSKKWTEITMDEYKNLLNEKSKILEAEVENHNQRRQEDKEMYDAADTNAMREKMIHLIHENSDYDVDEETLSDVLRTMVKEDRGKVNLLFGYFNTEESRCWHRYVRSFVVTEKYGLVALVNRDIRLYELGRPEEYQIDFLTRVMA